MKNNLFFCFLIFSSVAFSQLWEEKNSYPGEARHHPNTFVIDSFAYLLAGTTNTLNGTKDFYKYDGKNDSWEVLNDFPGVARGFSYATSWNGKGYIGFGASSSGVYLNDLWEFNAETGVWTQLSSCPCSGRRHPAFVIQDDKLFVGLGDDNITGNLNDWWEYDIPSDTWTQKPNLPGPERHHPFHFAVDGNVFVGMGHGNGVIYKDWYKWDITSESWEQMANFPDQARVAGTELKIGDRGFVLSGDGDDHGFMETGEFWEYNPSIDEWTQLPPHPGISRWAPGSFVIDSIVYFTSGEIRDGVNSGLQNDLWAFDYGSYVPLENDAALVDFMGDTTSCGKTSLSVQLQNFGTTSLTALTIKAYVDEEEISTTDWSGSLEQFDITTVEMDSINIQASKDITFRIEESDENNDNNEITVSIRYIEEEFAANVYFELILDNYPEETSWEITDDKGNELSSGGGYSNQMSNDTIVDTINITESGCYLFNIYDTYGDGLNSSQWSPDNNDGFYKLIDGKGETIIEGGGEENFHKRKYPFKINTLLATKNPNIHASNFKVFPNPANSSITL